LAWALRTPTAIEWGWLGAHGTIVSPTLGARSGVWQRAAGRGLAGASGALGRARRLGSRLEDGK